MIIDTDNYGAAGIEVFLFSGGEPHVKMEPWLRPNAHIFAKIRTPEDLLKFLAVCSALEHQDVQRHVFMPYLPGARQDRVQLQGAFTAEMYARLIGPAVTTLTGCDIHSWDAGKVYMDHVALFELSPAIALVENLKSKYDFVLAPDKGAENRATTVANLLKIPVWSCSKHRDPGTGRITIEVPPVINEMDTKTILLVDDICDGGATFAQIGEQMTAAHELDLFVTHGIFSKGVGLLGVHFDHIFTTDSFFRTKRYTDGGPSHVINLLPYYLESLSPA